MNQMVMSVLVDNTAGVLARVANLFSRRGYNIDSLTVSETENKSFSKMTICVSGDDQILEQIRKQVAKLEDVKDIVVLEPGVSVTRELILLKVASSPAQRQQILAVTDIFRAKIVDVAEDSLMIELTGGKRKLDAFTKLLADFEIKELVRTGVTGLVRGSQDAMPEDLY